MNVQEVRSVRGTSAPLSNIYYLPVPQLLLCVGEFFGTTPEAEAEWQQYKTGAKKGRHIWITQTSFTDSVKE